MYNGNSDSKIMRKFLKKLFSIKISELIFISAFIPLIGFSLSGINLNLDIFPPENPKNKVITTHPNLRALSIEGHMGYANRLMWLEDQEQEEVVQLYTDENSNFIAALDNSSLITQVGSHKVIAYMGITTSETSLIKSNVADFFIDKNFNVILDPESSKGITVLSSDMTKSEFEATQKKYNVRVVGSSKYFPLIYRALSYKETFFRFTVYKRVIYLILLLFVPYALMMRWRRKKSRHESFWSLGDGIYFQHNHSFPRHS